jgi:oligopeptidase B
MDNVKEQAYPNILVTAGLHDPRVGYWEPAKLVARLRELKTDSNLLLLKTEMGAGHFSVTGRCVQPGMVILCGSCPDLS